jgi:hypothetical protein
MTIPAHSTKLSEPLTETASKVEKEDKARRSRMRALVRRLTGRSKAGKADAQHYPPHRNLQQMVTRYAPDDQPDPENREVSHLME